MKTYTKQDFHNPEQLTRQQIGDEYRLLLPEEVDGRWAGNCSLMSSQREWVTGGGGIDDFTYRVPLATPLPDGTVLSSNDCCWNCCWSDDGFNMTEAFSHSSKTEPSGTTVIPNLWGDTLKPRKVTYIAGSMSAHPDDFNFPAFYAAAESLEKQGYFPINPAELDRVAGYTLERIKELDPAEFQEFLKGAAKRDLDALQQCDAIALLPGWENSKGARAEKAVAEWLGLDIYLLCKFPVSNEWELVGPCNADVGAVGEEGELGPVDTGYSDHIKQPDADGWIPHFPGDPMPCAGDSIVDIVDRDGSRYFGYLAGQMKEYWSKDYMNPIVKWRPAQPKQPYNSDERAEWGVGFTPITSPEFVNSINQFASDDPKGAVGAKKPPMHLLPPNALIETAKAMGHGAAKYGAWNFIETTVCASTYVGALGRHWAAYARSEDIDPDSGLPHLALIAANCFVLLTAQQQGTLRDDRPKLRQI